MPVPNEIRDQAGTKNYVGLGALIAGQILSCMAVYVLAFDGYGDAFVQRVFGVQSRTSVEVRSLFVLMSCIRAISQIFWGIYVAPYALPVGFAVGVDMFNLVVDTLGTLAVLANREELQVSDYIILAVFITGIALERGSEVQRTMWKSHAQNKGKPHITGLFGFAVHINYTGYIIWRSAMYALSHYWPLQVLIVGIASNFGGEIREQRARNIKKYGDDFKRYWDRTPKMFPGVY